MKTCTRSLRSIGLVTTLILILFSTRESSATSYPSFVPVTVKITEFEEKQDPDPWPFQGVGDYYAVVEINHEAFPSTGYAEDNGHVKPSNWVFTNIVNQSIGSVPVTIKIMDSDTDADDNIDINNADGVTDITLLVDLDTGEWHGDVEYPIKWSEGDGDTEQPIEGGERGKVWFDIIVGKPGIGCEIDLENNTHTCANIFSFRQEPSNGEVVFGANMIVYREAIFEIEYGTSPTGWNVNIGDSMTNDSGGGDSGTQSNDAELDIYGTTMTVHGKDGTPAELRPLMSFPSFVNQNSRVVFGIRNEMLVWNNHNAVHQSHSVGRLESPHLYALRGQSDDEGLVNYTIYAAFNRVIDLSSSRKGSGVKKVTVMFFNPPPTAITLLSFTAQPSADHVTLAWQTGTEVDNAGFNILRAEAADGPYTKLNAALIPAQGDPVSGASYTYTDDDFVQGVTYYYKLEDVDTHGVSTLHGPVSATPSAIRQVYLPLLCK